MGPCDHVQVKDVEMTGATRIFPYGERHVFFVSPASISPAAWNQTSFPGVSELVFSSGAVRQPVSRVFSSVALGLGVPAISPGCLCGGEINFGLG